MCVGAMALIFPGPLEWRHVIQQGPGPATAKPRVGDMESRDQDGGPSKLPLLLWTLIKLLSGNPTPPLRRQQRQQHRHPPPSWRGPRRGRARERGQGGESQGDGGEETEKEEGGEGRGEGRRGDGEEEKGEKRGSRRARWGRGGENERGGRGGGGVEGAPAWAGVGAPAAPAETSAGGTCRHLCSASAPASPGWRRQRRRRAMGGG